MFLIVPHALKQHPFVVGIVSAAAHYWVVLVHCPLLVHKLLSRIRYQSLIDRLLSRLRLPPRRGSSSGRPVAAVYVVLQLLGTQTVLLLLHQAGDELLSFIVLVDAGGRWALRARLLVIFNLRLSLGLVTLLLRFRLLRRHLRGHYGAPRVAVRNGHWLLYFLSGACL